ncbi:MAG TPA: zinc-ribbon domain-containing protein [Alphaproteobacteria bacterium]|nr:zinc-ribbon domain-containing protein [Alphaproteobacteria bacterium]
MQVSCPQCGTHYNLTAKQVGPAGRTLQCAKCKHKWFVAPAKPAASAATVPDADNPPPLPPSSLPGLDELASIGQGPRWWRRVRMGWGPEVTLTLAGIGVAVLAMFGFNWLLNYIPEQTGDETTGANPFTHQPGPQPRGLVLSNLSREVDQRGSNTVLVIHGTLTNATRGTATLPDLRVQLLDREGIEIDYWPVSYATPTLAPGQNTSWQVTFVNPPLQRVAAYRAFFANDSISAAASIPLDTSPTQE